jgi:hypothetical protein
MRLRWFLLAALVLAGPAHAQSCLEYSSRLHLIGKTPSVPGVSLTCVASVGSYAYCGLYNSATQQGEFWTVDLSDPAAPTIAGVLALPISVDEIAISGSYAYLITGQGVPWNGGLLVVDISDPPAPALVNTMGFGVRDRIAATGGRLCILSSGEYGGGRLFVYDLANPVSPAPTGIVTLPLGSYQFPEGLAVSGNYAYIGGMQTEGCLMVVDLLNLNVAAVATVPGMPVDVTVRGNRAYVAGSYPSQMSIVEITNPLAPLLIGQVSVPEADRVYADDQRAYITYRGDSDRARGFMVVDVADPALPSVLGSYGGEGMTRMVTRATDIVIMNSMPGTVQVVALESGQPARRASGWGGPTTDFLQHVSAKGTLAFAAGQAAPTVVLDVADPQSPVALARWPQFCEKMIFQGDLAYAACGDQFRVINVADPVHPVFLGSVALSWPRDLARSGTHVFVGDHNLGLKIIDVSDPAAPLLVSSMSDIGIPEAVAADGNFVYIATGATGLAIVDATDPAHPVRRLTVPPAFQTMDVEVAGGIAYVADQRDGVLIYDVSDPLAPYLLSSTAMPHSKTYNLERDGRYLYVSNDRYGLSILHVADPAHPQRTGNLAPAEYGISYEVAVGAGRIFMADGSGGLSIAWPQCAPAAGVDTSPAIRPALTASPNPSREATTLHFALSAPERVRLEVFDPAGRLISTVSDQMFGRGEHRLLWDGRDEFGAPAPSGVYVLRLSKSNGEGSSSKIVLCR